MKTPIRFGMAMFLVCGRAHSTAIGCPVPYEPQLGHRFNHHKLLLDPYAKQFYGSYCICAMSTAAIKSVTGNADLSFDTRDNAREMLKCVVVDTSFNWEGDRQCPKFPGLKR
jgi:pullulanase/glycogen debranching enzyme